MNHLHAQAFTRLLAHLDGSQIYDPTDLLDDVELLHNAAGLTTGLSIAFDEEALLDTLTEVAQRHYDGGGE